MRVSRIFLREIKISLVLHVTIRSLLICLSVFILFFIWSIHSPNFGVLDFDIYWLSEDPGRSDSMWAVHAPWKSDVVIPA